MRIRLRLLTNSVLIATFAVVITALLIGGVSYNYGRQILENEAKERLVLVRDLKANSVKSYFDDVEKQATVFAKNLTIIDAMSKFKVAFKTYADETGNKGLDQYKDAVIKNYINSFAKDYAEDNGGLEFDATPYLNITNESSFALQYNYIFNNPYGIDKESKLDAANDGTTFSKIHKKFHGQFKELKELFDFEDIFLVDADTGDIVYTVAKGLDFTTSLTTGPYAQTALGAVFRKVNDSTDPNFAAISDFEAYSPSNDDQAAFVAAQIYDGEKKIGVAIFQLNLNTINTIMTSNQQWEEVGLGKTGETYLVDYQHRMITTSRVFIEDPTKYFEYLADLDVDEQTITRIRAKNNNMGWQKVNTLPVSESLSGKTGVAVYNDYTGVEVLGAYAPLNINGVNWGIICKISLDEAFAPIKALARKVIINLIGVMLLIMVFSVIVGIGLARQISLPIERLSTMIQIISQSQDLTQRIQYEHNDEIGDMTQSLNQLIESFQRTTQETIKSTQQVQQAAHKLMALANDIDAQEATHKFQDNFDSVHEKTEAIKDAGDSLDELSSRLQVLSRQFKVFEAESERTDGW